MLWPAPPLQRATGLTGLQWRPDLRTVHLQDGQRLMMCVFSLKGGVRPTTMVACRSAIGKLRNQRHREQKIKPWNKGVHQAGRGIPGYADKLRPWAASWKHVLELRQPAGERQVHRISGWRSRKPHGHLRGRASYRPSSSISTDISLLLQMFPHNKLPCY